ncbi:hypothetical protein K402DRAFT_408434 [Aulographum hederae CBS 113979]|uniref:Uncharacterized protein n=1 Tax=Aulographum hederae CBS 113979 TaxID=1176131 RepID=A0A6G1GKH3_9PEZI|nr:hypothetical protein K402DRAFT_408434 [Aulographum hederae CBS 113979]
MSCRRIGVAFGGQLTTRLPPERPPPESAALTALFAIERARLRTTASRPDESTCTFQDLPHNMAIRRRGPRPAFCTTGLTRGAWSCKQSKMPLRVFDGRPNAWVQSRFRVETLTTTIAVPPCDGSAKDPRLLVGPLLRRRAGFDPTSSGSSSSGSSPSTLNLAPEPATSGIALAL